MDTIYTEEPTKILENNSEGDMFSEYDMNDPAIINDTLSKKEVNESLILHDLFSEDLNESSIIYCKEKLNDLSLTVYYVKNPFVFTPVAWRVDELINSNSNAVKKVVINNNDLEEYIDLFRKINIDELIPVKEKFYTYAKLYYVLESKEKGKIFDIAMDGINGSIFVNGVEYESHIVFYEIKSEFMLNGIIRYTTKS